MADTKLRVDYLTVRLTPDSELDLIKVEKLANQPIYDNETGEQIGIKLYPNQFHTKVIKGGTTILSFYNGGEEFGINLSRRYGLPVTRLDICIDIKGETMVEVEKLYQEYTRRVRSYIDEAGYTVSDHQFRNRGSNENGAFGSVFWSRAGEKQLRIYAKNPVPATPTSRASKPCLRIEWQLHKDLARDIFNAIKEKYPKVDEVLFNAFQKVTHTFLKSDMFDLGNYEPDAISIGHREPHVSNFESWVLGTVALAIARHFKLTGVDLSVQLSQEVKRIITAEATGKIRKLATKNDKAFKAANIRLESERALREYESEQKAQNEHIADI